jgi:predicted GIY-YIG superfamily endonuclease
MSDLIVYVFRLENDKFYIGKSPRIEGVNLRFHEHITGRGTEWTKKYKPISIIERYECDSNFENFEDTLTVKYMMTYGIKNVRGGSYSKIELEKWQIEWLETELENWQVKWVDLKIKDENDYCFKCGNGGHFPNKCETKIYSI